MSPRHRQSRWCSSNQLDVVDNDGTILPSTIHANTTAEQLDAYITHYRIQEITHKLRLPDELLSSTANTRSRGRSPDPEYDASGRRTNTRPQHLRLALEAERHSLVEKATSQIPRYRAPHDYQGPTKFVDKVYIPQTEFPGTNFIGQILGPRGGSLKAMQVKTSTIISIRGTGSVKDGRGKKKAHADDNQPLHVVVSADTHRKVEEGKRLIQEVIDNAVCVPEWQNTHKQQQLRNLAVMNGTFRDDEGRGLQKDRCRIAHATSAGDDVSECQLTGLDSESCGKLDLGAEMNSLMKELDGDNGNYANGNKQDLSSLPPWRVDRLLQQGHCLT